MKLIDLISRNYIAPLAMALALVQIVQCKAAADAATNGFKLSQFSKGYGIQDVYISPLGIKVINPRMGRGSLCCPPDWQVINWSTRTNKYSVEQFKKWKPYLMMGDQVFNGYDVRDITFGPAIAGTICKYPTKQYTSTKTFATTMMYRRQHRISPGSAPRVVTIDQMETPPLPMQIGFFMERMYQAPFIKGVPLRVQYICCDDLKSIELDTTAITPIQLTKNDYVFPKNMRKVESDQQLNIAPSNQDLKDLMGM